MTSESRSRSLVEEPGPESFRAFFETLPRPAALCDEGLHPRAINAALRRFCLEQGVTVEEVLGALEGAPVPEEGASREVEVALPGGLAVTLELARSGSMVSVVVLPGREPPERVTGEQERTEELLRALGRGVAEVAGEEELVATVARGVREVFPGRFFCIRVIDARTGGLTSLYAEGRLKWSAPEPLVLERSTVETLRLEPTFPSERVVVASRVPLLFEDSLFGVSAPLVANGQLYGSINLEYPASLSGADVGQDSRVLARLASQVAVGVKNAKLIDELTFVRKYLEDLLEKANALILVVNRDKQIVVFNQALSKLTGFSKEEVLGQDARWVLAEEERLRLVPQMATVMRGEALPLVEVRLRTRTGEAQASFATSTMLNAEGELEGVIAIGQDMTVVKELEQRVIQAEKLASLGQLAASVAHEINNPMTAVVSYADALLQDARLRGAEGAADAEKLRKIQESGQRILRFTRDLLSYARPTRERPEPVRLDTLLDTAVGYCEHVLAQTQVRVEREYGEVPALSAVPSYLEQVFVNLLTNACHAMEPGGRVWLRLRCEGREAVVSVEDSGSGIAPEHLSRIFEPFFTTKARGRGTGLGLSIVQRLVEHHGGWLEVHSELDRGTTFTVRLPLRG